WRGTFRITVSTRSSLTPLVAICSSTIWLRSCSKFITLLSGCIRWRKQHRFHGPQLVKRGIICKVQMQWCNRNHSSSNSIEIRPFFTLPVWLSAADPIVFFTAGVNALYRHLFVDALPQPGDARSLNFGKREIWDVDVEECAYRKS